MPALPKYKRQALERRRAALIEEYQAASAQLDRALSDVDRLRIQRQVDDLEKQIAQLERELDQGSAPQGDAAPSPALDPAAVNQTRLRTAMVGAYGLADLKLLCEDMGLDDENLPASTLEGKVLELIRYMRRRGRYEELVRKVLADRPHLASELQ